MNQATAANIGAWDWISDSAEWSRHAAAIKSKKRRILRHLKIFTYITCIGTFLATAMLIFALSASNHIPNWSRTQAADEEDMPTQRSRFRSSGTAMVSITSDKSRLPRSETTREVNKSRQNGGLFIELYIASWKSWGWITWSTTKAPEWIGEKYSKLVRQQIWKTWWLQNEK